jgi:hypothetical protein
MAIFLKKKDNETIAFETVSDHAGFCDIIFTFGQ